MKYPQDAPAWLEEFIEDAYERSQAALTTATNPDRAIGALTAIRELRAELEMRAHEEQASRRQKMEELLGRN